MLYVLTTLAASVYAIYATAEMLKNKPNAYRDAIIALAAILALGIAQVVTSRRCGVNPCPTTCRVYMSAFTLLVFLLLRTPRIWNQLGMGRPGNNRGAATGVTLLLAGAAILSVQFWAGPAHTFSGLNFADVWHSQLSVLGWALLGGGCLGVVLGIVYPSYQPAKTVDGCLVTD